jgi:23S rRNA pseudouridine1911/1915/1917 synthase
MADQAARLEIKSWSVPAALKEVRLDAFVRRCLPHLSRRAIEAAIREQVFLINGKTAKKGDRLKAGDALSFRGPAHWLASEPLPEAQLRVPIVYEDSSLLVVNKPAGMATHGFSGRDRVTLANFLAAERPELLGVGESRWQPGLVHRLDRDTSGLVLVAKTQAAFEHLRLQFRRRQIKKKYWALVWGITDAEGVIAYPLAHDPRDKRRMRAMVGASPRLGKEKLWKALTRFCKLSGSRGLTLIEVEMETGVTHEIRVHLAAIGHPIVGDILYGSESSETFGLRRQFLHAARLKFRHPEDGRTMEVEARLPEELLGVLKRLRIQL